MCTNATHGCSEGWEDSDQVEPTSQTSGMEGESPEEVLFDLEDGHALEERE